MSSVPTLPVAPVTRTLRSDAFVTEGLPFFASHKTQSAPKNEPLKRFPLAASDSGETNSALGELAYGKLHRELCGSSAGHVAEIFARDRDLPITHDVGDGDAVGKRPAIERAGFCIFEDGPLALYGERQRVFDA